MLDELLEKSFPEILLFRIFRAADCHETSGNVASSRFNQRVHVTGSGLRRKAEPRHHFRSHPLAAFAGEWKGSISTGPICLSNCSRTSRRARCNLVFTVSGLQAEDLGGVLDAHPFDDARNETIR